MTPPASEVRGKWALVTGASRGIGEAIAERLASEGVNLALHYRSDRELAEKVADRLRAQGVEALLFEADLSTPEGASTLADAVLGAVPNVEILVNNAGAVEIGPLWTMEEAAWERVQRINLESPRILIRAFLEPMLRNRWGRVVNITSILAECGGRGNSAYSVSKAGLTALTRAVALEVARKGITLNCVAPGMIATEMSSDMADETREEVIRRIPLRREGRAEEVAEAVVFLLRCGYVTGDVIRLDGGLRHAV